MSKHALWTERYRPQKLEDVIFQDASVQQKITSFVTRQDLDQHLLLSGRPGTGKTTIAGVLLNELKVDKLDVMRINASDETGVGNMRDTIGNFASLVPMGEFKIVLLDEADYLSPSAQAILRNMMETYASTTRFILTCNLENKIIPALKSRTLHLHFADLDRDKILERAITILDLEGIELENLEALDTIVSVHAPDMRKVINVLQENTRTGKLVMPTKEEGGDWHFDLLALLKAKKLRDARKLVCERASANEFEEIYKFMYENLDKFLPSQEQQEQAIVLIAQYLYKHALVADPEICFAAYMIELGAIA